ncbi:plasmid pRiA4b ORF-3 family protein [Oceanobacillus alkalisoli]|uniref:plasmid pRiA4b ORF-3 family protein n=1 Tax=Oceanobacillus alkalisoli TaxID=2925113 RepID=UPI001F11AADD|nr:plasmid pRiA4b ORF-3 family protein [Oceanobacillus alkalisoli]MCF3943038.1 plasmid pRiA4b ORF-3 family protein [Oceanobacillus alkalisoli]
MMIQCTKALLEKLGIKGDELVTPEGHEHFPNSFMAWHANFVSINRRKAIILMNNETRYPVVIYRPVKKDFSNARGLILEAITEVLRIEGVSQTIINAYIHKAGEISFSKTANRSMVAKLNNTVREIEFMSEYLNEDTKIQKYISLLAGRQIQKINDSDEYGYPVEKMLNCLGAVYELDNDKCIPVLDHERYQLKIQIDLGSHDVWRRVTVPSTFSFRHLHNIIQTVFDWQNYHLHEFTVDMEGNKPIKIIMDDHPETLEFLDHGEFDILQERFVSLEEIFSKHNKVIYEYDFGDSWYHHITLEKTERSHDFRATYLDGNGERPPEDVGGLFGYEEYLEVIVNENDPRNKEMMIWAESQKERKLNSEQINNRLTRVFHKYYYSPHFI